MLRRVRVLIIGCGYVGLPLGAKLVRQGHEVFGLRRSAEASEELAAAGISPLAGDLTNPAVLAGLPGPFDWVVNLASSSRGGAEVYREVYLEGSRKIVDWLAASPPRKYVYTSSTSVYGQTDGAQVEEGDAAEPATDTGRVLVETENLLIDAARERSFPAVILRVAGIYGPGRGHLFLKYLKGEATMAADRERLINMIHLTDLAGAIVAALEKGRPGEIYNVADDEPVGQGAFFGWLAETLGRALPPVAAEEELKRRKRGVTNKRVSNRKLKTELGVTLQFPNFRAGYTAEIERLQRVGALGLAEGDRPAGSGGF